MSKLKQMASRDIEREMELIHRRIFKLHRRLEAQGSTAHLSVPSNSTVDVCKPLGERTMEVSVAIGYGYER